MFACLWPWLFCFSLRCYTLLVLFLDMDEGIFPLSSEQASLSSGTQDLGGMLEL